MDFGLKTGNIYNVILKDSREETALYTGKSYSRRRLYALNLLFRNYHKRPVAFCFQSYEVEPDGLVKIKYGRTIKLTSLEKELAEEMLKRRNL